MYDRQAAIFACRAMRRIKVRFVVGEPLMQNTTKNQGEKMSAKRELSMRAKLGALVGLACAGMVILSVIALKGQRDTMLEDRVAKTRNLVEAAVTLVGYYENEARSGRLPLAEAQRQAKAAVSAQRYDGQTGYIFMLDKDFNYAAIGPRPELLGTSIEKVKTPDGQPMGDMFRNALSQNHGRMEYVWGKPGADKPVPKVSFVVTTPEWKWVVGTGVYVDDVDAAFWKSALELLPIIAVLTGALLAAGLMISRRVIRSLGGEPAYAAEIVHAISDGHLGYPVKLAANDTTSLLASIAGMQKKLRTLISDVINSADSLGQMAGEIEKHADVNAENSENQSQAAAAMAAAIEQLTTSITHIADNAQLAREQSAASGEISEQGATVINGTVDEITRISQEVEVASDSIRELAEKTESIKSIMSVIRDVADQTNLLALNAAIEAARAGESGRGFAVVADEVRKLAERTTQATQEIGNMIGAIQTTSDASRNNIADAVKRAQTGVQLAGQGGEAIGRIRASSASVVGVVNDISHSLQEQSQASNDIAQHVERIAQGAASNALVAKETATSTVELHQLTSRLRETVSRFQV